MIIIITIIIKIIGDSCCWSNNGNSINIFNIDNFSKNVLPKFFKHSNFQSFVRQLNMYDFHKTTQDPTCGEFQHQSFKQNRPDLLVYIKRKAHKAMVVPLPIPNNLLSKERVIKDITKNYEYDDDECEKILMSAIVESEYSNSPLKGDDENVFDRFKVIEAKLNTLVQENGMLKRMALTAYKKQIQIQEKMENLVNSVCDAITNESKSGNNVMMSTLSKALSTLTNDNGDRNKIDGIKKEKKDKKKPPQPGLIDNSLNRIPSREGNEYLYSPKGVELQRLHSLDLGIAYDDPMSPRYISELDKELGIPLTTKMSSFDKAASSITAPFKGDNYRPVGALERLHSINTFDSDLKLLSRMSSINSDEGIGNSGSKRKYSYDSNDSASKYPKNTQLDELEAIAVLTNIDAEK